MISTVVPDPLELKQLHGVWLFLQIGTHFWRALLFLGLSLGLDCWRLPYEPWAELHRMALHRYHRRF